MLLGPGKGFGWAERYIVHLMEQDWACCIIWTFQNHNFIIHKLYLQNQFVRRLDL